MNIFDLKSKKIGVLGFGVNNRQLVFWLLKHAIKSIAICDKDPEIRQKIESKLNDEEQSLLVKISDWRVGDSFLENLSDFDIVFRTPGLPLFTPEIQVAKSAGVVISSQTELFIQLAPCQVIGVTGTKGKSTTAAMIAHLLGKKKEERRKKKAQEGQVYLAGNIGKDPFKFIDELNSDDIVVLELSSFQLQGISLSPHIAVITRLGTDHLNYHQSIEEYYEAKAQIINFQKKFDYLVINIDSGQVVPQIIKRTQGQIIQYSGLDKIRNGAYVNRDDQGIGQTIIDDIKEKTPLLAGREDEAKVVGRHNMENWAAAVAVGYYIYGIKAGESREILKSFTGLPYRTEFIREVGGVRYYNDSYSTNPDSTIAALESFKSPVILICGGSSKNANFINLAQTICQQNVKAVLTIGEEGPRIADAIYRIEERRKKKEESRVIEKSKDLCQAVKRAVALASPGDVVLLSPACASFDMFQSATERGEIFSRIVNNLKF